MENNNFSVYKHTTPSNKVYIGITSQKETHRWGHDGNGYGRQAFGNAVRKYGWDNIQHEVICSGLCKEDAVAMEKQLIAQYHADDRHYGYNCTNGGYLCEFNEDAKKRISKALKGRKLAEEHKRNISLGAKGRIVSVETRRKIGEKHKNKFVNEETRETLRQSHQWQAKPVAQYTLDGEFVAKYRSIGEASRTMGVEKVCIRHACDGKIKTSAGYKWAYYEGGDLEEWQNKATDTTTVGM